MNVLEEITDENTRYNNFTVVDAAMSWYNTHSIDDIMRSLSPFSDDKNSLIKTLSLDKRRKIFSTLENDLNNTLINTTPMKVKPRAKKTVNKRH